MLLGRILIYCPPPTSLLFSKLLKLCLAVAAQTQHPPSITSPCATDLDERRRRHYCYYNYGLFSRKPPPLLPQSQHRRRHTRKDSQPKQEKESGNGVPSSDSCLFKVPKPIEKVSRVRVASKFSPTQHDAYFRSLVPRSLCRRRPSLPSLSSSH